MKVSVVNKNGIFSFYDVTHIVVTDGEREILFKAGFDAGDVPAAQDAAADEDKKGGEGK